MSRDDEAAIALALRGAGAGGVDMDAARAEYASLLLRLQNAETALRQALDCKGPFNGTVSRLGGEPAICTKCEAVARSALAEFAEREPAQG